jgi:sodium transport system permease protein
MTWRNIVTVYLKELKDSLRDRRTLMSMIIVPTLVMPVLVLGVGRLAAGVVTKARQEVAPIVVLGGEHAPRVVAALADSPRLEIVPDDGDWRLAISDKKIRAAVQIPAGFEAGLATGEAASVTVYHYEGELKSGFAAGEIERVLRGLRDRTVQEQLAQRGLPASLVEPFKLQRENVAPPEKVGGNLLGGLVPYMIVILCFTGAMYPAMDLTAGEKERGTMETLLCSPVPRVDIVLGKFLMVLTSSLAAMVFSLTSMGLTFAFGGRFMTGSGRADVAEKVAAADNTVMPMIDPAGVLGVLAMVLPVAVLFSAVIFTVSLFAKSYKEAQSYVAPLIFVVIMPAVVGLLPGIELNVQLALVPILNLSLVCKEMLSGVWNWGYIALIFGSSCAYAAVALWLAVRMFSRESVIFRM